MAIVLQRLQRVLTKRNRTTDDPALLEMYLSMPTNCSKKSEKAIFKLLVDEDSSLVLEYNMLRMLLQNTLIDWKAAETGSANKQTLENDTIRLVKEALRLSILLDQKYCHYINDRPNLRKAALEDHQVLYRRWLHVYKDHQLLHGCQNQPKVDMPFADTIRGIFEGTNRYRLGALRTRRLLIALIPILNQFDQYGPWILWLDHFAAPGLLYVNLLFFLPRLTLNIYTLGSHWIEHASMSPEERSLEATTRFNAQWDRLWPNLTNDIAWAANAAVVFFVLTGSLQPYGIYLGLVSQLYDLTLSSIRGYQEWCRFNDLKQQYIELHHQNPDNTQIKAYLSLLQKQIDREKWLILLSVANFLILFCVAILAFPSIAALSPWVPVAGAMMSVAMTLINFWGRDYITPVGAILLDRELECDMPAEPSIRRRQSSSSLLSANPSSFMLNRPRRSSSSPQLNISDSPITVSNTLSSGRFSINASPKKSHILTTASRDDFFLSEMDGNPSTSVKL